MLLALAGETNFVRPIEHSFEYCACHGRCGEKLAILIGPQSQALNKVLRTTYYIVDPQLLEESTDVVGHYEHASMSNVSDSVISSLLETSFP